MRKLIVAGAALVAGCNGGGSDSDPCGFEHRGVGATAQYHHDVTCATNPFPSDVLRNGSTISLPAERFTWTLPRTDEFDMARTYITNVASTYDADGFSTIAPITVSVDYPIDPATANEGVQFFRFSGGTPAPDATQFTATYDSNLSSLVLQPYAPLLPATTYGVVIDAELTTPSGAPTTRSREFGEAMAEATGDLAALIAAGGPTDRIALAFTFTTQSIHEPTLAVRDRIFGVLGSSLTASFADEFVGVEEGVFASGSPVFAATMVDAGVTGTNIGFIATGTFETFDFRGPDGLAWDDPLVTGPSVPPTETLIFRVAFPEGPAPVGGWPLVIYGHGLGGNESDVYEQAQFLGPRGFAVAGISAIEHGRRGDVISFFNWDSIPATRESLRQTTADQLQLLRMLRNAKSAGTTPFDQLDLDDVTYYGISLGGIMGSAFLATAPGVDRGLLIVPGGHVSRELYAPGVAGNYFYPYISTSSGIDYLSQPDEFADFLRGFTPLVQIGLDRGDGVNWAPIVDTSAIPVLMLVSEGDTVVTNETSFALRQAYDIQWFAVPFTDPAGVSGAWLYTTADFPELAPYEPHSWFGRSCEAREQAFHWLETAAAELLDPTAVTCP